ncbi:unnamed protein product, partial [Notodromas monacha]
NISEPLSVPGTSNRAELTAVLYAIHIAKEAGLSKLEVRTDSKYAKNCVTVWLPKWKGNNWQTTANKDVLNQNEIRAIDEAFNYVEVKFKWIRGHSKEKGNEAADRLARLVRKQGKKISTEVRLNLVPSCFENSEWKCSPLVSVRYYADWSPYAGQKVSAAGFTILGVGECEQRVSRFSLAEYRNFNTPEEAENYMNVLARTLIPAILISVVYLC